MIEVISLLIGFAIGYFSKGVTITVNKKDDVPTEYNPSYADELPKGVQEYVQERQATGGRDAW